MKSDNGIEDEDVVITKGFRSVSKKYAKSSSDSDNKEYEFQYKKKQRNVTQMEEVFTMNKWMKKVEKSESTGNALELLAEYSSFIL